jgi:hypothetical protein
MSIKPPTEKDLYVNYEKKNYNILFCVVEDFWRTPQYIKVFSASRTSGKGVFLKNRRIL